MPSELPKVAVLMAAYNSMLWIEEQLASVLAQVKVDVSVFISVDPSTDGTQAWCADFAQRHPNVFLLPAAGPFGGAARNFFRLIRDVDFSGFDYVALSDHDDIWYEDKLQRATAILQPGHFAGYSSNVVAFWPDGRRMLVDKAQPQVTWDYAFEAAGPGCSYVLSRDLATAFKLSILAQWERAQDVSLHDWYCYSFARSHCYRWFIDPVPGLDYRQHQSNQVGANSGVRPAIMRLRKIMGGWWISQIRLIASLCSFHSSESNLAQPLLHLSPASLLFKSRQCRRRTRDRIAFSIVCLYWVISCSRF